MGRFSIETFKAVIDRDGGLAKPNRFFVSFSPPTIMNSAIDSRIEYYCEAVNLPGFQLNTNDYRRYTYGPSQKRPFGPHVNPLQMTILGDGTGKMWSFFQDWMYLIMPNSIADGIGTRLEETSNGTRFYPYQVEYRSNYVTDVAIYHLRENYNDEENPKDFAIARTICHDCFPSAIVDIPLNWSDNNNITKFGVQLDYTDFNYRDTQQGY